LCPAPRIVSQPGEGRVDENGAFDPQVVEITGIGRQQHQAGECAFLSDQVLDQTREIVAGADGKPVVDVDDEERLMAAPLKPGPIRATLPRL
jgi:hypothetical protein